ncbi:MAG: GumN family protein [Cyanobacteria bacterium RYN_339]|nr:GumN family protein [Cyanobacteria bacterium RYN_339]
MRKFVLPLLAFSILAAPLMAPKPARAEFGRYAFDFNVFTWKITKPEKKNDDPLAPDAAPSKKPGDDPFMLGKTDYLVGTMHFPVKPDEEDVPGKLKKLLERSTAFAMEADLSTFNRQAVRKYLDLAPGQNLQLALPARTWQVLAANYAAKGVPPATLAHTKPWLLELMWANTTRMGNGLDSYLRKIANRGGKRLYYLEGMEDQIRALDAGTFEERVDMLTHTVDDPEVQVDTLRAMMDSYKAGYLDSSRGLVFDEEMMRHYPVYYRELFDNRNAAWMPKVLDLMGKEDAVIAVGLGHLVGPGGLLQMLKDRGYTVEALPYE